MKSFYYSTITCVPYRNGQLCVWECTIDPEDLIPLEPPAKKDKAKDSDTEDDIDIEKTIERTDKQARAHERNMQLSRNFSFNTMY